MLDEPGGSLQPSAASKKISQCKRKKHAGEPFATYAKPYVRIEKSLNLVARPPPDTTDYMAYMCTATLPLLLPASHTNPATSTARSTDDFLTKTVASDYFGSTPPLNLELRRQPKRRKDRLLKQNVAKGVKWRAEILAIQKQKEKPIVIIEEPEVDQPKKCSPPILICQRDNSLNVSRTKEKPQLIQTVVVRQIK